MYNNYVPQPFPFYPYIEYQNFRRLQCKGDLSTFKLIVKSYGEDSFTQNLFIWVPPFQIKRVETATAIDYLKVIRLDTGATVANDTSPAINIQALEDGRESLVWEGEWVSIGDLAAGVFNFYVEVKSGSDKWYSEVFQLDRDNGAEYDIPAPCGDIEYIRLKWSNPCNISNTIHGDFGGFNCYLPITLGQPSYNYKPDYEDNGDGTRVITFQSLAKRYTFFILAPEYMADALVAMQFFQAVTMYLYNGDTVSMQDIEVEVDWTTDCFAKVKVSFSVDVLAKTACCTPPA